MNRATLVGIRNYPTPIPPVLGADNDVNELATLLTDFGTVTTLQDEAATRRNIHMALTPKDEETHVVYLAGHGVEIGEDYYFVSHDTDLNFVPQTAVRLADLKAIFDRSPSKRILMFLDFCHSGGIVRGIGLRSLSALAGEGRIIVAACQAHEVAVGNEQHGYFTDALLRGLRGEAAINGEVTAGSLFDFIDRNLVGQRPLYFGQQRGRIVLKTLRNLSSSTLDRLRIKTKLGGRCPKSP